MINCIDLKDSHTEFKVTGVYI